MKTPPQKQHENPIKKDPAFPPRKYRIQKQSGFKIREGTLLETIQSIKKSKKSNEFVSKQMRNKIVATTYTGEIAKVKLVNIDFDKKVTDMMEGKDVSYLEYYSETYAVTIDDTTQPMAVTSDDTYVVPSLCHMTSMEKGHPLNIVCYNLLAKGYDKPEGWPYVDPEVLNFDYRGPRIIKELAESQADMMCL